MSVSNYTNVFGEPATENDLEHIFDILNENNDDRIQFREFIKHTENCGFKPGRDNARKVFDHIASIDEGNVINKKAWLGGVNIAHQHPLTQKCYSAIISGGQYEPQSKRAEIDIDEITKSLRDIKAEWRHRILCMESLSRQLTTDKISIDKFHSIFRLNHVGLTKQFRDRRSNVMRVACETEAKIIQKWRKEFSKYGCTLIEYLYEIVRLKIEINNRMGKCVLRCLVKNCPDRSKLKFLDLLGKEAMTSKYPHLKADCFDVLLVYFHHQTNSLKQDENFWQLLIKVTKKGVEDVDQIRNAACHLLAAIQVERHDLAFPIIKVMNDHLRKRYEEEYQISRGSGRGGGYSNNTSNKPKKQTNTKSFKDEFKENEHYRKHTWSTNDLQVAFAKMQLKQADSFAKKKKKKDKDKTKVKAKFPEPPPGQFFNCFGESLTPSDILYAFQFVDIHNDRRITIDEMSIACEKFDLEKANKLFGYLDVSNNDYVDYNDWRQALSEKKSKLMNFWYRVLSGKHLEEGPKDIDFDIEEANKVLNDNSMDQNIRVLALHSITRKMCTKLSEEKFHKLFKKCIGNLLLQLYDRKSYIVREACICVGKIMIARRAQFVKFANRTLEALYEIIKTNDEKIHISAHQAAKVLIRFIPDSKKFPIFAFVCKGCCDKTFVLIRASSFEYVNHILARMVQNDQDRNDRFWAYMEKILNSGLSDADQGVRDSAYSTLAKTEILRQDIARDYIKTLRKAQKEKYNNIKEYVLAHIQEEDFGSEGPGLLIALGGMSMSSNGSGADWGQVVDSPRDTAHTVVITHTGSNKKHKKKQSSVSKMGKISKISKGADSPRSKSSRNMLGAPSPKINENTRFTLTPEGFAELGEKYTRDREKKEKDKKGKDNRKENRKDNKNEKLKKQQSRKNSKSPNPKRNNKIKMRANTVTVDTYNNSKRKTNSKRKKNQSSLTTDDYIPERRRDRAGTGRNSKARPATARISTEKKRKNNKRDKDSDSLKKNKKNRNDRNDRNDSDHSINSKKKKKSSNKDRKDREKEQHPPPQMTMQQQARQALCITAHKQLVQVFIEKTEDLTGSINFNQFRECLDALNLDVGKGDALKAFSELDEEKEQVLDMEQFGHAVHVAYPEYDLLWKQLGRQKYKYYATLEPLMSLDEIKSKLSDKKSAWKDKTRAMRCACTIICDQKRKDNDISVMIKKLIDSMIVALRSNNQIVVREACITIATMAKERTVCLKVVVGKLLKTCWELLDVQIPLIKFSAGECLKIVIKYVPDDSDNKYLKTLIQGTMLHDFSSVRQSCYECIIVMILRAGNPNNTMGNDFWKRIKQIIIDGVQSSEQEVKDYAYHCLYAFEKASYQKAQRVIDSLDTNVIREYKKAVSIGGNDDDIVDIVDTQSNASNASNASTVSPLPNNTHTNHNNYNNYNNYNNNNNDAKVEEIKPKPEMIKSEPKKPEINKAREVQTKQPVITQKKEAENKKPQKYVAPPPPPINTTPIDEDEKEQPNKFGMDTISKIEAPSSYKIVPKRKSETIKLTTPIPSNPTLSTSYEERSKEIQDIYNKLDENKKGFLNRFKAMKFLKELMNVNMRNAEIILTGLDHKRTGNFTKIVLTNWAYAHSPEMEPNPILHKQAESIGWLTLRRPGLEKRIELFSSLLQLEKTAKNYSMVYDLDQKICILNYLLKQC